MSSKFFAQALRKTFEELPADKRFKGILIAIVNGQV